MKTDLEPFPRDILAAGAMHAAPRLLGAILVADSPLGRVAGRIVEVEAYTQDDPGSHSHRGKTARNATMFGPAGLLYVYWCYGVHLCANVVTGAEGVGEAVLLRALEPVDGLDLMRERRSSCADSELCRGPGNLTRACGMARDWDGTDLFGGPVALHAPARLIPRREIEITVRIGLGPRQAPDWLRRFSIRGHPCVSRGAG